MKIEQVITRQHMMNQIVGDYQLDVFYQSDRNFLIVVTQISTRNQKSKLRMSSYEPIWGIDVEDMNWILVDAEAMCEEFENENKEEVKEIGKS